MTYDENGGIWQVPEGFDYPNPSDTIPHDAGDIVEVRFDPVPELPGFVFLGWDTDRWAAEPRYKVVNEYNSDTRDDIDHSTGRFFVIGWEQITLYAIWKTVDVEVTNATIPTVGVNYQYSAGVEQGTSEAERLRNYRFGSFVINYVDGHYEYTTYTRSGSGTSIVANPDTTVLSPGVNTFRFSGTFDDNKQIVVMSSAPYDSADRLILLFDEVSMSRTATNTGTAAATANAMSLLTVYGTSSVEVQTYGENNFEHNGAHAALIRLTVNTDFIYLGQGDSKIIMRRSSSTADASGPAIGSQGNEPDQKPGRIQIETGMVDFFWANTTNSTRSTMIGGGGGSGDAASVRGSNSGDIFIRGGALQMVLSSQYQSGTGIGGGSAGGNGGSVDSITISGGHIKISQFATSAQFKGVGIGAGSQYREGDNPGPGDGGGIKISGGTIQIYQRVDGSNLYGTAIGGGGTSTGRAGDAVNNGGINISGGDIQIERYAETSGEILGAAIGGGGTTGSYQTSAIVNISGGSIQIKQYAGTTGDVQGAGIGGGGEGVHGAPSATTYPANVNISGGTIGIEMYTGTTGHVYSAGIGGAGYSNTQGQWANVNITGGSISVDRHNHHTTTRVYETTQDIGNGGTAHTTGSRVTIDGGSIWISDNRIIPYPRDSQDNVLYKTVVDVSSAAVISSVFVKKPAFTDPEFGVPRYADFHVNSKNYDTVTAMSVGTTGSGPSERYNIITGFTNTTYKQSLYLYLPAAIEGTPNEISVETQLNGQVKYFTSFGSTVGATIIAEDKTGTQVLYRVSYRIGPRMRYESDIVHIAAGTSLEQSFRAVNAEMDNLVAPSALSFVEKYSDETEALADVDPTKYTYDASDSTPLVNEFPLAAGDTTAYGNLTFVSGYIDGKILIIADPVERIDITYADEFVHIEDSSVEGNRYEYRVFGVGYDATLGRTKASAPYLRDGDPIATPLPEPANVVWTSDLFMFVEWRLGNAATGDPYDTDDEMTLTESGDLIFYSTWEWKGRIYFTEDGPGHIEYTIDGGATWRTAFVTDDDGNFFPVPLATIGIKAVPTAAGDHFIQWGDDMLSYGNNPQGSVTVEGTDPEDYKHVAAWFATEVNTLTVDKNGGGVDVKIGSLPTFAYGTNPVSVPYGETVILTATAPTSSSFSYWEGTVSSSENPLTISSFTADHSEKPIFTTGPTSTLTVNEGGGSVTVTVNGTTTFNYTGPVTFDADASVVLANNGAPDNKVFSYWSGSISSSENPSPSFDMSENRTVTANYADEDGGLLTVNENSGSVTVKVGDTTFDYVGPVRFDATASIVLTSATPPANKVFSYWSGSVNSSENPAPTIIMSVDRTVTANYADENGKVLTVNENGGSVTVTVNGTTTFNYTGPVTFDLDASIVL
ncbi:MAG: hypothetical protein LBT41_00520, partial [Candidatus Methanoplasma sp.]|nr:hypothetical protein [Candidatus Methanoplasma sp.]